MTKYAVSCISIRPMQNKQFLGGGIHINFDWDALLEGKNGTTIFMQVIFLYSYVKTMFLLILGWGWFW